MGLFGIGANKSSSKSSSESQSTDFGQSSSFGASTQNIAFEELFAKLYGDAAGASGKVAGQIPEFQGQAAQLFSGGTGFLDSLMGGDEGSDYLKNRVTGDNNILDQQIAGLQTDIGKLFNEELLPGIKSNSINSGTLGGGRQGVAQGLAAERVTQQFARGATELRAQDQQARDAAARDFSSGRRDAASTGLSALPSVLGLAEAGAGAEFLPVSLLADVLGGPTTLTDSLSRSESVNFGQSTSRSKSKGKSAGFSFGSG